jgi:hypothetical protein
MKTTVVCRDVRPATGNSKLCVVIASQDEQVIADHLEEYSLSSGSTTSSSLNRCVIIVGSWAALWR